MKLKLDKKIESLSDVFNFSDVEKAKQFIEQKGYFTNNIYFLENIQQLCQYGTLTYVYSTAFAYNTFRRKEDGAYYEYFIPESFLKPKEKKFRPYTLAEFRDKFPIEQPIKFRKKGEKKDEWFSVLTGYWNHQIEDEVITYIFIGPVQYTLDELFEEYEWQASDTEEFKPFGVEE